MEEPITSRGDARVLLAQLDSKRQSSSNCTDQRKHALTPIVPKNVFFRAPESDFSILIEQTRIEAGWRIQVRRTLTRQALTSHSKPLFIPRHLDEVDAKSMPCSIRFS